MCKRYEGYFKNGKYEGKGNLTTNRDWSYYPDDLEAQLEKNAINIEINPETPMEFLPGDLKSLLDLIGTSIRTEHYFYDLSPMFPLLNAYVGEFKNNEYHGKGKEYVAGELVYNGKYKAGSRE